MVKQEIYQATATNVIFQIIEESKERLILKGLVRRDIISNITSRVKNHQIRSVVSSQAALALA